MALPVPALPPLPPSDPSPAADPQVLPQLRETDFIKGFTAQGPNAFAFILLMKNKSPKYTQIKEVNVNLLIIIFDEIIYCDKNNYLCKNYGSE